MKPLSNWLLGPALVLSLSGAGFTTKPARGNDTNKAATANVSAPATVRAPFAAATLRWMIAQPYIHSFDVGNPKRAKWDMSYYWYSYPSDSYVDYNTVAAEAWSLSMLLGGVEIDTNPIGGQLLEKGYLMYGWPHGFVYQFLYGHFLL